MSTLRVARLEMDAEVIGKVNCLERRTDNFGDAVNGDQEEVTDEWRDLRNTIFLVVNSQNTGSKCASWFCFWRIIARDLLMEKQGPRKFDFLLRSFSQFLRNSWIQDEFLIFEERCCSRGESSLRPRTPETYILRPPKNFTHSILHAGYFEINILQKLIHSISRVQYTSEYDADNFRN